TSMGPRIKRMPRMPEELIYKDEAAAEYDRGFAHVTRYFMPFVLRAARVARGMRVLDIAAGTGLSAEAALSAVGPARHGTAARVSPAMAEKARDRLGEARNASVLVEDAQALSFSDETFDAVICNLADALPRAGTGPLGVSAGASSGWMD